MAELYGRAALFDEVVPALVGLKPNGSRLKIPEGSPQLVVCGGGRRSGKTAVLQELSQRYAQEIPQAYVDLGAPAFGQPGLAPFDEDATHTSPTLELLFLLVDRLSRKAKKFHGTLSFPRLTQGLLAVTNWQEQVRAGQLVHARSGLADLLAQGQPTDQARRERRQGWVRTITDVLAEAGSVAPPLDTIVRGVIDGVAAEMLGPRPNGKGLGWWAARGVGTQGDGADQLVDLALQFRGDAPLKRLAERHLLAAFLEDIASHYGWRHTRNGVPRPLLLLDNAHSPLGRLVLDGLVNVWHEGADGERRMRPAVVATALRRDPEPESEHVVVPAEPIAVPPSRIMSSRSVSGSFWRGSPPLAPAQWVTEIPLALLTLDEVRVMFGKRPPTHAISQVLRLSGGRAGIAYDLVTAAVARADEGGDVLPGDLLDHPAATDTHPPVHVWLLGQLIPDGVMRRRLTYYSPALDDDAAFALSASYPPNEAGGGVPVPEARDHLRYNCWDGGGWPGGTEPFVADPTLRALLLHALRTLVEAARAAAGAGPAQQVDEWTQLHRRLRARYDPLDRGQAAERPELRYLHHSLALNERDFVVRSLHGRYSEDELDARAWLGALNLICAAPHPPRGLREPSDRADCPYCRSEKDAGVHQAIDLLVAGVWQLSDPLAVPDHELVESLKLQLGVLSRGARPGPQKIFHQAEGKWPALLDRWHQAPGLPIDGGTG
ncbi:hypothetical protein [Streptomyces sp. NPDC048442]|uniref:hypothetical protein n=1 Tax=Streptomyces sp. NPDC048442 TaxID=3154823 RepID=UPI0034344D5F